MSPSLSISDFADKGAGNAKHIGNLLVRFGPELQQFFNALDVALRKFSSRMYFASLHFFRMLSRVMLFTRNAPAFSDHVVYIVLTRAGKKMFWIHARWIVALVADEHAWGNRTEMNLPGKPVRQHIDWPFPFVPDSSVSAGIGRSYPVPTARTFFDLGPEFVCKCKTRPSWHRGSILLNN